jgi:hypothetical protein
MFVIYLVPILVLAGTHRVPAYFHNKYDPSGIQCDWSMMDYGFTNFALLVAKDISQEDQDFLALQSDVFRFPAALTGPVDQEVQPFFEAVHLPTDWMTPATTWIELLRQVAGMMQFNQRYGGIAARESGEIRSIFDTATLDTRLRQMGADEQAWFLEAVETYGYDSSQINDNNQLRLLVRQAGDFWAGRPFYLGGIEF